LATNILVLEDDHASFYGENVAQGVKTIIEVCCANSFLDFGELGLANLKT
jgi:hypothetical protein